MWIPRRILQFLYLAAVLASPLVTAAGDTQLRRPNVVLILADDMGWSDIGCYGGEISTPNLDRLADGGVRFTSFHNTAKCFPSRACLLSGLYAQQCGMDRKPGKFTNAVTLAEVLRGAGYRTLMTGKHHGTENPYDRGFDRYSGLRDGGANYFNPGHTRPGEDIPAQKRRAGRVWCFDDKVLQPYTPPERDFYSTDYFTKWAIDFLEEYKDEDRPFFLYVAYQAPHDPLQAWPEDIARYRGKYRVGYEEIARARYRRQREMGLVDERYPRSPPTHRDWEGLSEEEKVDQDLRMAVYAAMIECMDRNVGKLLAKIREMGEEENTLVLFASDNGSSAEVVRKGSGEIGTITRWASLGRDWANVSNTPFRLFKNYSHEGGICTPFIAYWPAGVQRPGRISDWTGHFIDVMATLTDITGAGYPQTHGGEPVHPMAGESFLPVLRDEPIERASPLFWQWSRGHAVRRGKWKLVSWERKQELFDMKKDRTETRDVSRRHKRTVGRLESLHRQWTASNDPAFTTVLDQYRKTDVAALIGIADRGELEAKRRGLAQLVFGRDSVPTDVLPQGIEENISDDRYARLESARRIDSLTYHTGRGINSRMFYFHAREPASTLVLYHQGHGGDFVLGKETIQGLLESGHDVIALAMPLKGDNSRPLVHIDHVGWVQLESHNWMRFLERPLRYFMEPMAAAVNHALASRAYSRVAAAGLSGGGWSVTLYAAMDERVSRTYQVGGTMPFYLRSPVSESYGGHLGDFEQNYPPLIEAANYLEMYVLGASGEGRRQIQLINQFDTVAAHGVKYRTYEKIVQERVARLGAGEFSVWLDTENPVHTISPAAVQVIVEDLAGE